MRVSIIIPVYRAEDYIADCLSSVLAQSMEDFEVICVDDGSPDDSAQVVQEFADRDPRVKLLKQENGGASAARNAGFDASTAEFVTFVDADDEVSGDFLELLLAAIEQHRADIAMGNKAIRRHGEGRASATGMRDRVVQGAEVEKNGLVSRIAPHGKLYRRSFLAEHGIRFFEGITYEDYIYWTECLTKNPRVATLAAVVYTYKRNPNSISSAANRLAPFNIHSRMVQTAECLRIIRDSGLKSYEKPFIRLQFESKIMAHIRGLTWSGIPLEQRQEAYRLLREELEAHRRLISTRIFGWRRLVLILILDGTFEETLRVLRFAAGQESLPVRILPLRQGARLYVAKSELPSLAKFHRKFRDVSDVVKDTMA